MPGSGMAPQTSGRPRHRFANSLLNLFDAFVGVADDRDAAVTHRQDDAVDVLPPQRDRLIDCFLGHQQYRDRPGRVDADPALVLPRRRSAGTLVFQPMHVARSPGARGPFGPRAGGVHAARAP